MIVKPRHKRFLEELPLNNNVVTTSAIKAGYSKSYANSFQKTIVRNAVKETAKELLVDADKSLTKEETKQLLCEIMGIDKSLLLNTLKKIAMNDKDYSSAIKILAPLAKEAIGLELGKEEQGNITVPVLNIGVIQKDDSENTASNKDIIEKV